MPGQPQECDLQHPWHLEKLGPASYYEWQQPTFEKMRTKQNGECFTLGQNNLISYFSNPPNSGF